MPCVLLPLFTNMVLSLSLSFRDRLQVLMPRGSCGNLAVIRTQIMLSGIVKSAA